MKTNDIKKSTKVKLRNGWDAIMEDNRKGNTRMCTVFGVYTEIGSIYSHDIVSALVDGEWVTIEHTPTQKKLMKMVESF